MREEWPGIFIHSIVIGDNKSDLDQDKNAGFFDVIARQVQEVCSDLAAIPELQDGFNAVGFSQGGLFWRAYVQQCPDGPPIFNLVTLGSPLAGTSDIPGCLEESVACTLMRSVVKNGVYWSWVQSRVVQAQYFKDPNNLDAYYSSNIFLPELNQEGPYVDSSPEYRRRLQTLNKLALIRFTNDTMIVPRDSAWFSFYNEQGDVVPIQQQPYYKTLGLDALMDASKIDFHTLPGEHMRFEYEDLRHFAQEYLVQELVPRLRFQQ
ncbi:hypothetical protein HDV03_001486 [Kappamyces sp. JEL0829]|nr:hypothetical protein HDV03_001486 [Kappamyces sp. JEL0829]